MKVSVILPVYNGEKHLAVCLESLAVQTLQELEVICIDDGSKDKSGRILDEFQKKHPDRFRVFHLENSGVYKAREAGIDRATGEYVGFCDCDDVVENDMYEQLYNSAVHGKSEMAICAYQRTDGHTGKVLCQEMDQFGNKTFEIAAHKDMLAVINTALWNKIIRHDIARKYVRFENPPRIAEDMMFLLSLYPYVNRITFCSRPLYHYYVWEGSAMSAVRQDELEVLKEAMMKTKRQVESSGKEEWEAVLNLIAFIHFGIAFVLKATGGNAVDVQNDISKWLDSEFRNWRRNPYLQLRYVISGHMYLCKPMIVMWVYKIHLFPVFLKLYVWITETLGIDIKW